MTQVILNTAGTTPWGRSLGVSLFDQPPASLAALIEQGDAALYESKRGGRDSIRLVDRTVAADGPLGAD